MNWGPVFICHWSWKGGNKHPYTERIIWLRANGLTVSIYCGQEKKRPQRVQPIWSLNRAVTNSSDNPVSGANIGPECLKQNGDPPGPAWQIVSDWQSICLPTNFQLSNNVESVLRDYGINTTFLIFSPFPCFLLREFFLHLFTNKQHDSNVFMKGNKEVHGITSFLWTNNMLYFSYQRRMRQLLHQYCDWVYVHVEQPWLTLSPVAFLQHVLGCLQRSPGMLNFIL